MESMLIGASAKRTHGLDDKNVVLGLGTKTKTQIRLQLNLKVKELQNWSGRGG